MRGKYSPDIHPCRFVDRRALLDWVEKQKESCTPVRCDKDFQKTLVLNEFEEYLINLGVIDV